MSRINRPLLYNQRYTATRHLERVTTISTDRPHVFGLLDRLIDRWCARRALEPLRVILSAYPPAPFHTDEWATLYAAVFSLKGIAPDRLPEEDRADIAETHAAIYQLLQESEAGRQVIEARGITSR